MNGPARYRQAEQLLEHAAAMLGTDVAPEDNAELIHRRHRRGRDRAQRTPGPGQRWPGGSSPAASPPTSSSDTTKLITTYFITLLSLFSTRPVFLSVG